MPLTRPRPPFVLMGVLLLLSPHLAQAYMGPGLGLGAIGAALGVVGAVFLGVLSVVWYPFKRLWRKLRGKRSQARTPRDVDQAGP